MNGRRFPPRSSPIRFSFVAHYPRRIDEFHPGADRKEEVSGCSEN